jgi:hypothetical protein
MSFDGYAEWLDRLAATKNDDELWSALGAMHAPREPLARAQIRERLIAVLKNRGVSSPARAADSWIATAADTSTGGPGRPEPRAQVHTPLSWRSQPTFSPA